jgi:hypothetical protein
MVDFLVSELQRWRADAPSTDPDALVFPTMRKRPYRPRDRNNIRTRVLAPAVREANRVRVAAGLVPLPERITPHTLRRTFVAMMLADGRPVPEVQMRSATRTPARRSTSTPRSSGWSSVPPDGRCGSCAGAASRSRATRRRARPSFGLADMTTAACRLRRPPRSGCDLSQEPPRSAPACAPTSAGRPRGDGAADASRRSRTRRPARCVRIGSALPGADGYGTRRDRSRWRPNEHVRAPVLMTTGRFRTSAM